MLNAIQSDSWMLYIKGNILAMNLTCLIQSCPPEYRTCYL